MRSFRLLAVFWCALLCLGVGGQYLSAQTDDHDSAAESHGDEHVDDAPGDAEHGDEHAEHGDDEHGGGHGGGHHDPTDLSHQNATPSLESFSEIKSDLAIWTFVLFLCLLGVLAKFAWGPLVAGLEKREQAISAKIEEAQHSAEQAAKQLQQYEAKLAAATEEAREIVSQARRDAEAAGERIVSEAQDVANRERERAVEDIRTAKSVAVQEISERTVDLAVAMAGQLIRREVSAGDRSQLIREALDQLPGSNN